MNSQAELESRVASGQITWAGPVVVMIGRSFFMIAAQGLVAAIFALRGHPSPWNAAAPWWSVWGTLVDIGCLMLMANLTRAEGIGLRDLIGKIRLRRGQDIFLGIGCLLLGMVLFGAAGMLATKLVFGTLQGIPYSGLLSARRLPVWAVIYSLSVWWLIWSPTEEMTYNGYVLPRIQALTGRKWIAVMIVGFWWALQHSFLPLIWDWKYVLWRFLFFLPGVLAWLIAYLWIRRLFPLILAHWPMDASAQIYTLSL
ncbi:MAG: type II CAAX prenyl endopeptidase Rce1 family protein [Terriglobales bacterium]